MGEKSVYNNLHTYAFNILKSYISNPLSDKETQEFAKVFLISSQKQGEDAKTSIYHNIISKYIVNNINKDLLSKNIDELTNEEAMSFENSKKAIKQIIDQENEKNLNEKRRAEKQKNEIEKAKEQLNETKTSQIESKNGTQFVKFEDPTSKTPIVAEKVGNTTVADMIDKDASFIIDGSGNSNVQSVKTSEQIIEDVKKEKITNVFSMNNLNTSNNDNLENVAKEEIGILKSSDLDLNGAKYDTTTGLAFLQDGKILDTEVKSNGDITISELGSTNSYELPKNNALDQKQRGMSKTQLITYISELEEKGVSREEASTMFNQIDAYRSLSDATKENLLNNFNSIADKENTISMDDKKSKEHVKVLAKTKDAPSSNAGIASSIIISFVAGIISGVIIMLLVYFFLTH